jgi:hypothetical protein
LRRAFAADIFKADGFFTEMAQRKAVHVMRFMRFKDVRFEQGVMDDAAQRDTMIRKNMCIVFQVLPDLGFAVIFQPRLSFSNTDARDNCAGASAY